MRFLLLFLFVQIAFASSNDWATEVVDYQHGAIGFSLSNSYIYPKFALGPATRSTKNIEFRESYNITNIVPVRVFEAPWQTNQVVTIGKGGYLTLKFATPVINMPDPEHLYGVDLIVYGNSFFLPSDVNASFDSPWSAMSAEKGEIWLSRDLTNWFQANGRYADDKIPTQSIDIFGNPSDYLQPVDPAILTNNFTRDNLIWSYTNTVEAYQGAAGGTPVDLEDLLDSHGAHTNLAQASYIKIVKVDKVYIPSTEIDAVAKVQMLPEPATFYFFLILGLVFKKFLK